MTVTTAEARKMMSLFEGYAGAYGTHGATSKNDVKGGKLEIKSTAATKREPVTVELWQSHLDGSKPIGIIPIRDNNTCLWGCIDIDQYGVSHIDIVVKIAKEKLPLTVCRSKSGGAHLFLFCSEPVPAEVIQERLREMAALLGFGSSEVFPKQSILLEERGDLGSWLNMPYYGGDDTERYAYDESGLALTLGQFLRIAESRKQNRDELDTERRKKPERDPDWGDGPPCFQHLVEMGFPEGTRNKGLFNLATFAKKKYGTEWETKVEQWNFAHMSPPLNSSEVQQIIKQQQKKEYNYTCKDSPLCNHCNSGLCRTRAYGVGAEDDIPTIGSLSVLDTEPPLWFLDVDRQRLELTTEELQNYSAFHKVCMERLHRCYKMMKRDTWFEIVSLAMREVVKIEAPIEVGQTGQFLEHLREFVTNRTLGDSKEDLLLGKPFKDDEEGRYYFRLGDLMRYLSSADFKHYTRPASVTRIRELGGERKFFFVKGKGVNAWWIPVSADFSGMQETSLPDIDPEPI